MIRILLLTISCFLFSCSSDTITSETTSVSFDNLKAYNKNIAFFYYSPDPTINGNSRIYLDTIAGSITQYTSHRSTNQSDSSEEFGIKKSVFYGNYKNTNVDFMLYEVNNNPLIIMMSHDKNSNKFEFKRFSNAAISFSNNAESLEYYKKLP